MTSEENYCNPCNKKFISRESLIIHNNYEHQVLLNMWMQQDVQMESEGVTQTEFVGSMSRNRTVCHNTFNDNSVTSPSVETTPPSTPQEYDYKQLGHQNSAGMVSNGPNSGSSDASYHQQSSTDCYHDYDVSNPHQSSTYSPYIQPTFHNLVYEDNYKGYQAQRYQPYSYGRSPLPTPSPSASLDIKEEPLSPEILDLDSQKFLNNGQSTMPDVWRNHQAYEVPPNQNSVPVIEDTAPVGLGVNPLGINGNTFNMANVPAHSFPPQNHTVQRSTYAHGTFYPQGMQVNPISSQYTPGPISQAPAEEGPPTSEYAPNVKRTKCYQCIECNKWFTSHGHLKRHYNTTLHKNMIKNARVNGSVPLKNASQPKAISPPVLGAIEQIKIKTEPARQLSPATCDVSSYPPSSTGFMSVPNTYGLSSSNNGIGTHFNPTPGQTISSLPPYAHSFNEGLIRPMYHGHFSTDSPYPPMHNGVAQRHLFGGGSFAGMMNSQLPLSEYSNQIPVEAFNSFRLDVDKNTNNNINAVNGGAETPSPLAGGDTASEGSPDSNGSASSTSQPEKFECKDCKKKFNRMCYLTQHRSTYHDGEKPFKCSTCGKRFTEESTFQEHQSKHAGEKPYKCEICPKQFNHKTDLRRHMCLHTGEKPFACEQCGKGFIRKDHMIKHLQTHRKKNNGHNNSTAHNSSVGPMRAPTGMMSHPGMPNRNSSILSNHIANGIPNHVSPAILPSHSPVGLPHHSPVAMPLSSPIGNPQFVAPHPPIPLPSQYSNGHPSPVVAPPVY